MNETEAERHLVIEILEILPPFLWFGLLMYLLVRYRRQVEDLFRRLSTFKGTRSWSDARACRSHRCSLCAT
jgi:hypothetical protein